jgi:hypothetical protein
MGRITTLLTSTQALITVCVVAGCATAACMTGHISGAELVGLLGGAGGLGGAAHVVTAKTKTPT